MFKALLIILISGSTFTRTYGATSAEIKAAFEKHKVIPDVVDVAPTELLGVEYKSKDGLFAKLGNHLPQLLVEIGGTPKITWKKSKRDKFYFLIMTDLDRPVKGAEPGTFIPGRRQQRPHWIVWNIPGGSGFNVSQGTLFRRYLFPGPAPDKIDRFSFLVFEQPSKLTFEEDDVDAVKNRTLMEWAQKYKMGNPVAGNFMLIKGIPYDFPENRPPLEYTPTFSLTESTEPGDTTMSGGRSTGSSTNPPAASILSFAYIPLAICCIFRHSLRS